MTTDSEHFICTNAARNSQWMNKHILTLTTQTLKLQDINHLIETL